MSVAIEWEGPDQAFQAIVESMKGLLVDVTPAHGGPVFTALLTGGREDDDADPDQVQMRRVDEVDLKPVGEAEYLHVARLRMRP
jgi:hypothetical protein